MLRTDGKQIEELATPFKAFACLSFGSKRWWLGLGTAEVRRRDARVSRVGRLRIVTSGRRDEVPGSAGA